MTRSPTHTQVIAGLTDDEKLEALNAHPAIGQRTGLSARSAAEQGADADPAVLEELARLNADYERKFGFRFVVFVNRRPKAEILEVLRNRIDRTRQEELDTAVGELVAIAEDRWRTLLADYTTDWLDLIFRWFHVTAAIVWIGTSFYFVALDNHLHEPEREVDREEGVGGESWEIHGGGFYRIQKFRVAPPHLPKPLHWYKWEAYWTWLSGFALLCIVYYTDARLRLIDPAVADLEPWQAILISIALLVGRMARLRRALPRARPEPARSRRSDPRRDHRHRLRGRAALRRTRGVPPGRRDARDDHGRERPVRDHPRPLGAGEGEEGGSRARPEVRPARQAALGAQQLPDPACALHDARRPLVVHLHARSRLGGARRADGRRRLRPPLLHPPPRGRDAVVDPGRRAAAIAAIAVWLRPHTAAPATSGGPAVSFTQAASVVKARCAPCHSMHPTQPGFSSPPANVVLDTPEQIHALAAQIHAVAVESTFMPLGNATHMTQDERDLLGKWIAQGAKIK